MTILIDDRKCVILQAKRARCALNKYSGVCSGNASL